MTSERLVSKCELIPVIIVSGCRHYSELVCGIMLCRMWSSGSGSSVSSDRCQMRSVLSGDVGLLPTQYFTEYSYEEASTPTASLQSVHAVKSSPVLSVESLSGQS